MIKAVKQVKCQITQLIVSTMPIFVFTLRVQQQRNAIHDDNHGKKALVNHLRWAILHKTTT